MNRTDQYNDQIEDPEYGSEFVVLRNGDLEVRTDVYPHPIGYVRVVRVHTGNEMHDIPGDPYLEELVYWNTDEFVESKDEEGGGALGAMLAAIGSVARGEMP